MGTGGDSGHDTTSLALYEDDSQGQLCHLPSDIGTASPSRRVLYPLPPRLGTDQSIRPLSLTKARKTGPMVTIHCKK